VCSKIYDGVSLLQFYREREKVTNLEMQKLLAFYVLLLDPYLKCKSYTISNH
jgi:hypothetical protein